MKLLGELVRLIRTGLGLADPADSRLTPDHGWLLPAPAEAIRLHHAKAARLAERLANGPSRP